MSKVCEICGKGPVMGRKYNKLMSKYNPTPKVSKKPNLQWATLESGERVKACTRCKKTLLKKSHKEK
jgi:ribosomal protein L28